MDKPQSILIFGVNIPINYVDGFDDPDVSGIYDPALRCISVLENKEWAASLFHESMHAALDIAGVSQALGEALEEAVVHCIENSLKKYFVPPAKKKKRTKSVAKVSQIPRDPAGNQVA